MNDTFSIDSSYTFYVKNKSIATLNVNDNLSIVCVCVCGKFILQSIDSFIHFSIIIIIYRFIDSPIVSEC